MAGIDAFGVILAREETPGEEDYEAVANIHNLSGPGLDREEYDVTTHESPDQWEEMIFGIKRSGEVSIDVFYVPDRHDDLLEDYESSDPRGYAIIWPDPLNTAWSFEAGLKQFEPEAPHDGPAEASLTFKLSGPPDFDADITVGAE